MAEKPEHEDWTPWSIWRSIDLPDVAFERLARGGVWRVQEPLPDIGPYEVDPSKAYRDVTVRVAVYKVGRARSYGSATVLGRWEGDKDWVEVGWIEEG